MDRFDRVAIVAKPMGNLAHYIIDLIELVVRSGCTPCLDTCAAAHLGGGNLPYPVADAGQLGAMCDVAIALGGDGTMLGAARALALYDIPIIGINAGRLGFITDVSIDDMPRVVPAMLSGNCISDRRRLLEGRMFRNGSEIHHELSVNDIGISHGRALGMVEYTVFVDGLQMAVQRADGVIVSSATGSTAYAMAAGGPIMHPNVPSMLVVPIAPHTLSNRPIVLSSASVIDIVVNETRSAVASFDAQMVFDIVPGDMLRVCVSRHSFTMLHPVGYNHFDLLRRKLQWNYLPNADKPIHTPEQLQAQAMVRDDGLKPSEK